MRFIARLLPLVAVVAAIPARAEPVVPRYVRGDLVHVRARPHASAGIVARLHINTPVGVRAERDDWLEIVLLEPDELGALTARPGIEGWVRSDLIGHYIREVAAREEADRAHRAEDLVSERVWAERLVAIAPAREEHLVRLRQIHRRTRNRAGLARIEARLDGSERMFVGICHGTRALLVASRSDGGPLQPMIGEENTPRDLQADLRRLVQELDAASWFVDTSDGPAKIEGSPFVRPFLAPLWNEEEHSPFRPGSPVPEGGGGVLVLGPCPVHGRLFATAPIRMSEAQPIGAQAARRLGAALDAAPESQRGTSRPIRFMRLQVVQPFEDLAITVVAQSYSGDWMQEHGISQGPATFWALVEPDGSIVKSAPDAAPYRDPGVTDLETDHQWFRPAFSIHPGGRRFGIAGGSGSILLINIDPAGRTRATRADLERSGC